MKRLNLLRLYLAGFAVLPATAQNDFKITESVIAGGGATLSTGGSFSLSGTIGQPITETLRGGHFTLVGGFWGVAVAIQHQYMPLLTVTQAGNTVQLSWPVEGPDLLVKLQQTESLGEPTQWADVAQAPQLVDGRHRVTVPANPGNRFFRLTVQNKP